MNDYTTLASGAGLLKVYRAYQALLGDGITQTELGSLIAVAKNATLAEVLGTHADTVRRYTNQMVTLGWLKKRVKKGRSVANRYKVGSVVAGKRVFLIDQWAQENPVNGSEKTPQTASKTPQENPANGSGKNTGFSQNTGFSEAGSETAQNRIKQGKEDSASRAHARTRTHGHARPGSKSISSSRLARPGMRTSAHAGEKSSEPSHREKSSDSENSTDSEPTTETGLEPQRKKRTGLSPRKGLGMRSRTSQPPSRRGSERGQPSYSDIPRARWDVSVAWEYLRAHFADKHGQRIAPPSPASLLKLETFVASDLQGDLEAAIEMGEWLMENWPELAIKQSWDGYPSPGLLAGWWNTLARLRHTRPKQAGPSRGEATDYSEDWE